MPKLGGRYLWFKLALVVGSLLGLLLLVQSAVTYHQVSRRMVIDELWREAQRQVDLIPRDVLQDPAKLQSELEELRRAAPDKIAWIKLTESFPEAPQMGPPRRDIRSIPEGEVLVRVLPLRTRRVFPTPGFRGQMQTPPALPPARPTDRPPGQGFRSGPRMVEIALYLSSARAVFGPLLTNLIVNSTAALGLVAAMILIWARFPHYMRGKQLEQQTELARKVQTDLLPSPTLALENLDFAAECVPAWQVGGDFYDVFNARDGRTAIVLGDVSGKGLPASVVAGLLLGAIRSSGWVDGSTQHETASQALSELLRTRTSVERFASLFWCYYEPATRSLRYVNAGHLPPMVVTKNGGAAEVVRLEEGGPVLGVVPEASYRQGTAVVADGAVLVLYSDGVVEATNAADEQYGEERLSAVISENVHRPSAEIRDEILEQVHLFLGKERAQDDLTLVVARLQRQ